MQSMLLSRLYNHRKTSTGLVCRLLRRMDFGQASQNNDSGCSNFCLTQQLVCDAVLQAVSVHNNRTGVLHRTFIIFWTNGLTSESLRWLEQ